MTDRDRYIRDLLRTGKLRPKAGHFWCEKVFENKEIEIDGVGTVSGVLHASGLVLVGGKSTQDEAVRSKLVVVRALGGEPPAWRTRWFHKERTWPATWESVGVAPGVALLVRAVSGVEQANDAQFIEIRYDEIVAVGQPHDAPGPDMLPAPGWLLVDIDPGSDTRIGSIYTTGSDHRDALENNRIQWGTVTGLPNGYDGELTLGDRAGFARFDWTEYVQAGMMRYMPQDEVLCVEGA